MKILFGSKTLRWKSRTVILTGIYLDKAEFKLDKSTQRKHQFQWLCSLNSTTVKPVRETETLNDTHRIFLLRR